jgi:hypothetical protein
MRELGNGPIASVMPLLEEDIKNVLEIKENNMENEKSNCCNNKEDTSAGTCCKSNGESSSKCCKAKRSKSTFRGDDLRNKNKYREETDRLTVLLNTYMGLASLESIPADNKVAVQVEASILELLGDNKSYIPL